MAKTKKVLLSLMMTIAACLAILIPFYHSSSLNASADDISSSEIDSITTNLGSATVGSTVHFTMTMGNSKQVVHTGDTVHVDFPSSSATAAGITGVPSQIPVFFHDPSDAGDPLNGKTIGEAHITSTGVTVTFNSEINGRTIDYAYVKFDGTVTAQKGTTPTHVNNHWPGAKVPTPSIHVGQKIPATNPSGGINVPGGTPNITEPTGQVEKMGNIDSKTGNVDWQVHGVLGQPGTTTVSDTAQEGQTFVPGSFKVTYFILYDDGYWGTNKAQYTQSNYPSSIGTVNTTSNGFTMTVNDYNAAAALMGYDQSGDQEKSYKVYYTITYQTKLPANDSQVKQWTNDAKQTNPDNTSGGSATGVVVNHYAAEAEGTQPKNGVELRKVTTQDGKEIGLAGAQFTLTGNGVSKTVTSTSDGTVEFSGLKPGTYHVSETQAPTGYYLNNETITATIAQDGTTTLTEGGKPVSGIAVINDASKNQSSSSSETSSSSSSSSASSSSVSSSKVSSSSTISTSSSSVISSSSSSSTPIISSSSTSSKPIISSSSTSSLQPSSSTSIISSSSSIVPSMSSASSSSIVPSMSSSIPSMVSSSTPQVPQPVVTPQTTVPVSNQNNLPKPSANNNQGASMNMNAGKYGRELPLTGETVHDGLTILGIIVLVGCSALMLNRRKNK